MPAVLFTLDAGGIGIFVVSPIGRTCAWTAIAVTQQQNAVSAVLIRKAKMERRELVRSCMLSSMKRMNAAEIR